MKNPNFSIFILSSLLMTCLLIGCEEMNSNNSQGNIDKNDHSERRVKKEKKEEEPLTYEQEKWLNFKEVTESSLRYNWMHIIELRSKIRREGYSVDALKHLDSLEKKYDDLETRFDHYNSKGLPNLDSYSREYNRDMKELTKVLNTFNSNDKEHFSKAHNK
jgi:hypothetical protein